MTEHAVIACGDVRLTSRTHPSQGAVMMAAGMYHVPQTTESTPLPPTQKPAVCIDAVERILKKATGHYGGPLYHHTIKRTSALPDGTNICIIEDVQSGVRYVWTVSPDKFEPVKLGAANE